MRANLSATAVDATVHIVDDDPFMRQSLSEALDQAGYQIRCAQSAAEFLANYHVRTLPECLLLDVRLPDMDGLALYQVLRERGIAPTTIFLSGCGTVSTAVRAIHSGGVDFLEKPVRFELLIDRVRQALVVDRYCRHQLHRALDTQSRLEHLSLRERDVLELLVRARSVKQIATELKIGLQTVAKHKQHIFDKLGVDNDAQLVLLISSLTHFDQMR